MQIIGTLLKARFQQAVVAMFVVLSTGRQAKEELGTKTYSRIQ